MTEWMTWQDGEKTMFFPTEKIMLMRAEPSKEEEGILILTIYFSDDFRITWELPKEQGETFIKQVTNDKNDKTNERG